MGDLPGHPFRGNQYAQGGGSLADERSGPVHPHDAAKHEAETSTKHTGLDHLKEHPVKEVFHAIASAVRDAVDAVGGK